MTLKRTIAGLLAVTLAVAFLWPAQTAYAVTPQEAQATLDSAESRLVQIGADQQLLLDANATLQEQIDATTARVLEAQAALTEANEALESYAVYEYREQGATELVHMLFSSSSLSDILSTYEYLARLASAQIEQARIQRELMEEFDALVQELNAQLDAQQQALLEVNLAGSQAAQIVQDASAAVAGVSGTGDRIASLNQTASSIQDNAQAVTPTVPSGPASDTTSSDANTTQRPDPEPSTPVQPSTPSGGSSSGSSSSNPQTVAPGGTIPLNTWLTGTASAYGGSTDAWTPNPGITGSGAVCDDWSMGVAIPMVTPRYWTYYGHTVEIVYNGRTVFATVNDCGGMGGGTRVLDLQPGVWKAFGFSSCHGWGLRTVLYRIL